MNGIIGELKELRNKLLLIENEVEKQSKDSIDGSLIVSSRRGKSLYFHEVDGKREYLGIEKSSIIEELERKAYLKKLLKATREERETLKNIQAQLEKTVDVEQVFFEIPPQKRHLIKPFEFTNAKLIKMEGTKRVRVPRHVTLNGELVRSKSELIIADRLKAAGVPYVYEPAVLMEKRINEVWYPDFQCCNTRTGTCFYWEHFGKMDDAKYLKNFHSKLERYVQADIVVGKNLIISTESTDHPLDVKYVERMIKEFLI